MTKNLGYTFEMAREVALGYSSKTQFQAEHSSLYKWCWHRGFWPAVSAHMIKPPSKRKWTSETIRAEALRFSKKVDFASKASGAYAAATKLGILVDVCNHMQRRMLACEVLDGRSCSKCFVYQPPSAFVSDSTMKSGYGSMCKRCHSARTSLYAINNLGWKRAQTALRRSKRKNATPPWLSSSDYAAMRDTYKKAQWLSEATALLHEVDHILPIGGRMVCGLHVPWNLQILPKVLNREKSNRVFHV